MSSKGIQIFVKKAPWVMTLLMEDFDFDLDDTAAIVGNGGYESDGLQAINEIKPTVKGSRGGFSWFQWTADRRVAFEKYCARNNLSPSSDKAAYNWLFVELTGPEARAVPAVKNADSLEEKVKVFERTFERAGVQNHAARLQWAERALTAYAAASDEDKVAPWLRGGSVPVPTPRPAPEPAPTAPPAAETVAPKPAPSETQSSSTVSKTIGAGKGGAAGSVGAAAITAAIVAILNAYDLLPPGEAGAGVGAAIGVLVTGAAAVISSMIGTYQAKRNKD